MMVWPYLTIWEEKVESSAVVSKYAAKRGFPTFLKNIEIWFLGSKYRSEMFRNRKSTLETYFLGGQTWQERDVPPPPNCELGGGSYFFEYLHEYLLYDYDSMCAGEPWSGATF